MVGLVMWPVTVIWLKYVRAYRIRDLVGLRRRVHELLRQAPGPVVVCPNHLTWIDSLMVQWVISPPLQLFRTFRLFCWNVPEQTNLGSSLLLRMYCYIGKCLPIRRGGDRAQQNRVLENLSHMLYRGDLVMVFPEGGRSESGRVEVDEVSYGVGRIVNGIENCQVLCVYLRGDRQTGRSLLPDRKQSFCVQLEMFEPKTDEIRLRATRDIALQIGRCLARLEEDHFAGR
jgi:1-acyl-sn-glycerol-3-phosphate acyltransferase